MSSGAGNANRRKIELYDQEQIEIQLREAARLFTRGENLDDLEIRHLIRVISECSLLLTDIYSPDRIDRVMHPESGFYRHLVDQLIAEERQGEGEVFYRIRRLPDNVRVLGDKALFDQGLQGISRVMGYELAEIGFRAYMTAADVLERLAEDRRLRSFFLENRLLMLPLEDEVEFLRQCANRFPLYAGILRQVKEPAGKVVDMAGNEVGGERVFLPAVADSYLTAAKGKEDGGSALNRDEMLSAWERMLLFSSLDMDELKNALITVVVDQPHAVEALCDEFSLFAAGTVDLRKPPGYFLVGPTGVGKNHLVESLVRLLEGVWKIDIPVLTIEGPNYTYPSDINELKGATRGFIRSDEEGLLTTFHKKSSKSAFSVILVDEVEKAHPQLRTFFLSILDRGTTTDNRGNVLNFANAMVFFTSNLGYSEIQQRSTPIGYMDEDSRFAAVDRDVRKELKKELKPEFINRLRLIHFSRLTRSSVDRILDLELERIARRYREVHGLDLELGESARRQFIDQGFSPEYGARHLAASLDRICNVEISKKIRRDDRRKTDDREDLLTWIRSLRSESQPLDLDQVRKRVLDMTRASLDYDKLRIEYVDGEFRYLPGRSGD